MVSDHSTVTLLREIAQTLFDKKSFNIIAIDVRSFSTMTDYFLVAEGTVERHVAALGRLLVELCAKKGFQPHHVEGLKRGDWVVLDFGDFVIHLMETEMREKYRLEEIWKEGKIVDLKLKLDFVQFSDEG